MILVFAGAGASKAVNPSAYPTAMEFFNRLEPELQHDNTFAFVKKIVLRDPNVTQIDVEMLLWTISELLEWSRTLLDPTTPIGFMFDRDRARALTGTTDFRGAKPLADALLLNAGRIADRINRAVYQLYGAVPTETEVSTSWIPLLNGLQALDHVELFTTNYDVVLEAAIHYGALAIDTGRTTTVFPTLDESLWERPPSFVAGEPGLLTKLHGSVDWTRDARAGAIRVGKPDFSGRHADQVIIYPGYKSRPTERPFTLFHTRLQDAVASATVLIFIGFAFRDAYINDIVYGRLRSDAIVITINPAAIHELQIPRGQLYPIIDFFDEKSIHKVLEVAQNPSGRIIP
jgi:hypothetical protein